MDLAGLDVVGEAGDEERDDALPLRVRVRVRRVHVVGVPQRRRGGREEAVVGEAHLDVGRAEKRRERRRRVCSSSFALTLFPGAL